MGKLHFPPAADLTGPDRLVLDHLQKDYEQVNLKVKAVPVDASEESDDSATKRTEFVSPSPEGTYIKFFGRVTRDNTQLQGIY
jgi:hypothetical protein